MRMKSLQLKFNLLPLKFQAWYIKQQIMNYEIEKEICEKKITAISNVLLILNNKKNEIENKQRAAYQTLNTKTKNNGEII